ncbi:MAG: hypothetical protein AAFR79_09050 [Pseudomonadota bacterium]
MAFDAAARAARDAAFRAFGSPVRVDPDGAAIDRVAILAGATDVTDYRQARMSSETWVLQFKAEEAPAEGAVIALLDTDGVAETERRQVQGKPQFLDSRRLVVEADTRPA